MFSKYHHEPSEKSPAVCESPWIAPLQATRCFGPRCRGTEETVQRRRKTSSQHGGGWMVENDNLQGGVVENEQKSGE